jgi:hypothetical protein
MSGSNQPRREPWRHVRRAVAGGLLIVAPAVLMVGCGSTGPTTTTSSGSAQTGAKDPGVTAAFEYARCMRSHGVSGFPDPKIVTRPGSQAVTFRVNHAEVAAPAFKTASKACQSILPAPSNPSPAQQQARKNGLLAFARCMREKGIAGFPDPSVQGDLGLQRIAAAGIDIHSRKVLDTAKGCAGVSNGAVKPADIEAAENGAH